MRLTPLRTLSGGAVAALLVVGLAGIPTAAVAAPGDTEIQVLGINDFHGRIQADGASAGAAVIAGAVNQLRGENPNTVFAAAGDLIGASTFESFIAHDKPTIDAMNAAGLQVSAVGNHEFDQGYNDLVNRVMAPYDAATNPYGGAEWAYLGANVRLSDGGPALPETWIETFPSAAGGDPVTIGFVGAVTDHLDELVSPTGIVGLTIEAPVVAANRSADELKAAGADIVILLVHEGAATPDIASATDPASDFGKIVTGANDNIDAIISGHTHLTYNHMIDVPGWADRAVTQRPVVSAGQYGYNLDQIVFTVDASGAVTGVESHTIELTTKSADGKTYTPNYPADATVQDIVDAAVADSEVLGAVPLGEITAPLYRARLANGNENRGGESTLGNLVAEAQRWATRTETTGSAQIALMNPGGLRQDMLGNPGGYPAELTYKQAAVVQPFANTLVNMRLTGEQLKTVLEQQWQPEGASRPFLRLGLSSGFTYTYNPAAAAGAHITGMWLNDEAIDPASSSSVTANSFLAAGGDNFYVLADGTDRRDTGQTDLQAMVDFMAANTPVSPDFTQRSVGVQWPSGSALPVSPGDTVGFSLSSLIFSAEADPKDESVCVSLGDARLGCFAVDTKVGDEPFDEYGTADVRVTLPSSAVTGNATLTITGEQTGTTAFVPITIVAADGRTVLSNTGSHVDEALPLGAALLVLGGFGALAFARRNRRRVS